MKHSNVNQLVEHLFRHEAGKMLAILAKIFGLRNLAVAEDVIQETLLEALHRWSHSDIPENPSAWLMQVAKRKTINILRQEQTRKKLNFESHKLLPADDSVVDFVEHVFFDGEIRDSQLRMIFSCCHPSLPVGVQIAFTLKTLCGFGIREIASSLLTKESTINKRLYRAKEKIRSGEISFEIPTGVALEERINAVCLTIYLLFNEGYNSSHPSKMIRKDLCAEALRLGLLLTEEVKNQPQCSALVALMLLHSARFESRIDEAGGIIIFKDQDRTRWSRELINAGLFYLRKASTGKELSAYHLEAGIAAEHSIAGSFNDTNWKNIYRLYELLYALKPSPIIELNQAIALSQIDGFAAAVNKLKSLESDGSLKDYYLLPATLGTFYFQLGKKNRAKSYLLKARELTQSQSEINYLNQKINLCE